MAKKRVVLAYSGGLDTSVAVRWMTDNLGVEVIAVAIDVGQGVDEEALSRRASSAGAVDVVVVDARAEFASEFISSAVRANALYEGKYPLVSAMSRPVIARHLVEQARLHSATAVAHGATGKGNDQVRFEVSVMALAPDLEIIAPVRDWTLTREDSISYAHEHGIEIQATRENPYSIDANLWGRAIECGVLEDPWQSPPEDVFELTRPRATGEREITIGFEEGIPVSLDGRSMPLEQLIEDIGSIVGSYGFGRVDMVENRRVGIKSREVYECPGSLALILAHADLESLTLERDLAHEKARMEPRWAELVYDGLWYSPLREAYDAFIASTQRYVTGEVRLRCESGGRCYVVGRRSPYSLYDYNLATYEAADSFNHKDAEGFVRIWGLGIATWSRRQGLGTSFGKPGGKDPR
ncbi:MAG: argininosuccinate synthase [Actinobacteria bacterium]|nr:argininosuccinate synthase [Actinomycetota bacterium]MCL6094766.1 argininosuccinate synthase [Actinomycetota bacterium]